MDGATERAEFIGHPLESGWSPSDFVGMFKLQNKEKDQVSDSSIFRERNGGANNLAMKLQTCYYFKLCYAISFSD